VVAGIDGCRAGWVVATAGVEVEPATSPSEANPHPHPHPLLEIEVVRTIQPVLERLASGALLAAGVDIPVGLAEDGPRRCDAEARRALGRRRNSVFPAPARAVLAARSYEEACALSRVACGKAVSKQLFHILPKIRQVDTALARMPEARGRLFEMSPELSFTVLAGAPLRFPKRTAAGRAERLAALAEAFPGRGLAGIDTPRGAQPDDVLDALVGVWTARRYAAGVHLVLGGKTDRTGLPMAIVA